MQDSTKHPYAESACSPWLKPKEETKKGGRGVRISVADHGHDARRAHGGVVEGRDKPKLNRTKRIDLGEGHAQEECTTWHVAHAPVKQWLGGVVRHADETGQCVPSYGPPGSMMSSAQSVSLPTRHKCTLSRSQLQMSVLFSRSARHSTNVTLRCYGRPTWRSQLEAGSAPLADPGVEKMEVQSPTTSLAGSGAGARGKNRPPLRRTTTCSREPLWRRP